MVGNISKDFNHAVDIFLNNSVDKDRLYECLRQYRGNMDLQSLFQHLKTIINCPERVPLYEAIRPLIPCEHQVKYDRYSNRLQPAHHRLIRLVKKSSDAFGFAIRGGLEYKTGFYIADIVPDSLAWKQGLRVGDQIVRMNGYAMDHVTHPEALHLLRDKYEIVMKVRRMGLVPSKKRLDEPLIWEYASDFNPSKSIPAIWSGRSNSPVREGSGYLEPIHGEIFNIFLNLEGDISLGCSICSRNTEIDPCVFVQSVKPDSLGDLVGIKQGDEILSVNGLQLAGLGHSHAVLALKCTPHLLLTLRKGTGYKNPAKSESNRLFHDNSNENYYQSENFASTSETIANLDGEPNFANQKLGRKFTQMETNGREIYNTHVIKEKNSRSFGFEVGVEPGFEATGRIMVTRIYYHSPALSAGIRVGDYLLTLDNMIVTKMMVQDVQQLIENIDLNTGKMVVDVTLAKAPPEAYEEEINDMSPIFDLDAMLAEMSDGSDDGLPSAQADNPRLITFSTKL